MLAAAGLMVVGSRALSRHGPAPAQAAATRAPAEEPTVS